MTKNNHGFTLIEMIVSLGIFAVVAVIALGALVQIISANKKAQTLLATMTNMNFALDAMSREIRTGTGYYCWASTGVNLVITPNSNNLVNSTAQGCPVNDSAKGSTVTMTVIAFNSSRIDNGTWSPRSCNLVTVYRFISVLQGSINTLHIQKAEQQSCGFQIQDADYADIFSTTNVTLDDYQFGVGPVDSGGSTLASEYPFVFIRLKGYAGAKEKDKTYFDIQTTISSRTKQSIN